MADATPDGMDRRLVIVGAALLGIFGLGTFTTRHPDFDAFFGVELYGPIGFALSGLALAVTLLLHPRLAEAFATGLRRAAARAP